jgi:hypothetical protein
MENTNYGSSAGKELEEFLGRSILVLCAAGSDRSRLIAEELEKRGYIAKFRGASLEWGSNPVEREDLDYIGTIVFSSALEKKLFDKNFPKLNGVIGKNNIGIRILNISEDDKERAFQTEGIDILTEQIRINLDSVGLKDIRNK